MVEGYIFVLGAKIGQTRLATCTLFRTVHKNV